MNKDFKEALLVRYRDEPLMVGKIFNNGDETIFLHEQSGSQKHWSTDCSAPVDVVVIEYLTEIGVRVVHSTRKGSLQIFVASVALIAEKGQRLGYDDRDRYYLPDEYWTKKQRTYEIVFCPREHVLEVERRRLPPISRPPCEICGRPLSVVASECGGMLSQIHVGLTRNGVTCRYSDPDDNPVSTWREAREGMKRK